MGPKCNDDKYYFNGIYYHFNPSSNSDLLNGVVTIAKIDDNNASSKSTYSSNKINELIDSVSGSSINDDVVSTETTYSSSKIVELINSAGFDMVVVDELPTIGERNTIYFVPSSPGSETYNEYIYTDDGWEKIGTTGIDLTDYYTKGETDTLLLAKQDTLIAGTNISINSANTISALGYIYNASTGGFSVGQSIENTGNVATAFGVNVNASGEYSHAEGWYSIAGGKASHAEGIGTVALNLAEHAEGQDNVSHKSSNVNGDSGNTLSSIGCDFDLNSSKNAREIMQNGDYYLLGVGGYDGIHIKGEDTGITVHTVQEVINGLETDVAHKQDTLTAGTNITIDSANTISAVDTTYVPSDFDIKDLSDSTGLRTTWSGKQDELTPGANITIDSANTISAVDTTYVASDFDIKDLSDSTGLKDEWSAKQDELIPGTNINIDTANTINVEGYVYDDVLNSITEGLGTIADGENQHVLGKYNVADFKSAVIVGNGHNNENRSNAYQLDYNGNSYQNGDVTCGGSAASPQYRLSDIHKVCDKDWGYIGSSTLRNAFKITALVDGVDVTLYNFGNNTPYLEYSINNGLDWEEWDYSTILLGVDESVYFKGNNANGFSTSSSDYSTFVIDGRASASGNIAYLIDETGELESLSGLSYCFIKLFENATGLTVAPELQFSTLSESCYESMFAGCTNLLSSPELPASTLVDNCYKSMFSGCTNMNHVRCLATDVTASGCTTNWLSNVPNIGLFITDPSMTGWTLDSADGIPTGWQEENIYYEEYLTFEILTSGILMWKALSGESKTIEYSINGADWVTGFTSLPAGAPITVYEGDIIRFRGENSAYASSKSAYSGFEDGTATYNVYGNIMSLIYGDNFELNTSLPGAWTFCSLFKNSRVISAENLVLPAKTLKQNCYRAMFSFSGYTSYLTVAPKLPATTLANYCYWYMFENCTSLTTAPDLLASTLVAQCYGQMFSGCTNLNYIKCLATTGFNTSQCLTSWVLGVQTNSGTFVRDRNTTWTTGNNGIPSGWTQVPV